jgi:hypothetical protein
MFDFSSLASTFSQPSKKTLVEGGAALAAIILSVMSIKQVKKYGVLRGNPTSVVAQILLGNVGDVSAYSRRVGPNMFLVDKMPWGQSSHNVNILSGFDLANYDYGIAAVNGDMRNKMTNEEGDAPPATPITGGGSDDDAIEKTTYDAIKTKSEKGYTSGLELHIEGKVVMDVASNTINVTLDSPPSGGTPPPLVFGFKKPDGATDFAADTSTLKEQQIKQVIRSSMHTLRGNLSFDYKSGPLPALEDDPTVEKYPAWFVGGAAVKHFDGNWDEKDAPAEFNVELPGYSAGRVDGTLPSHLKNFLKAPRPANDVHTAFITALANDNLITVTKVDTSDARSILIADNANCVLVLKALDIDINKMPEVTPGGKLKPLGDGNKPSLDQALTRAQGDKYKMKPIQAKLVRELSKYMFIPKEADKPKATKENTEGLLKMHVEYLIYKTLDKDGLSLAIKDGKYKGGAEAGKYAQSAFEQMYTLKKSGLAPSKQLFLMKNEVEGGVAYLKTGAPKSHSKTTADIAKAGKIPFTYHTMEAFNWTAPTKTLEPTLPVHELEVLNEKMVPFGKSLVGTTPASQAFFLILKTKKKGGEDTSIQKETWCCNNTALWALDKISAGHLPGTNPIYPNKGGGDETKKTDGTAAD